LIDYYLTSIQLYSERKHVQQSNYTEMREGFVHRANTFGYYYKSMEN